jgi:hypothetical protein
MTERTDIGYIEISKREDFMELWGTTERAVVSSAKSSSSGTSAGGALEQGADHKGEIVPPTPKAAPMAGGKTSGASKAGGNNPAQKPERNSPNPKSGADVVNAKSYLIKATKTKRAYHEATSTATSLKTTIKTNSRWAWANSAQGLKNIDIAIQNLSDSLSPFMQSFMCTDINFLKSQHSVEEFNLEIQKIPAELDPKIAKLVAEVNKLNSLHAVEISYLAPKA